MTMLSYSDPRNLSPLFSTRRRFTVTVGTGQFVDDLDAGQWFAPAMTFEGCYGISDHHQSRPSGAWLLRRNRTGG